MIRGINPPPPFSFSAARAPCRSTCKPHVTVVVVVIVIVVVVVVIIIIIIIIIIVITPPPPSPIDKGTLKILNVDQRRLSRVTVWGLGFGVWGLGFGVWGLRVTTLG